jgi:two-component system cell cycle sensor histidine kinase/response regulator CckA
MPSPRSDRPYRVLVVDDEPPIRLLMDRVLRFAGYDTALAANGTDAIQLLETEPRFDLLLTDLVMPDLSGDDVASRACELFPELKVLYVTGYSDRLFQARAMLGTHEAFLEKPISSGGLLEAVSLALFGSTRGPASRGCEAE